MSRGRNQEAPDLDGGVVGADEVPAAEQVGAVGHAERVGHLGGGGGAPDGDELLTVPGGQVGVVAAEAAVPASGEAVEAAAGAPDVRTGAGFGDQDALDPQLVDGALHGLLGDAEHLGDGRDGRQPLARPPVAAADLGLELRGDLPVRELGGPGIDLHTRLLDHI